MSLDGREKDMDDNSASPHFDDSDNSEVGDSIVQDPDEEFDGNRDLDFHSEDIKERSDYKDLFVNVEGAERREKEAYNTALKYAAKKKEATGRFAKDLKRSAAEHEAAEKRERAEAEAVILERASAEKEATDRLRRKLSEKAAAERREAERIANEEKHAKQIADKEAAELAEEKRLESELAADEQKRYEELQRREEKRAMEAQKKADKEAEKDAARLKKQDEALNRATVAAAKKQTDALRKEELRQQAEIKKQENQEKARIARAKRHAFFWNGWHKFITLLVILLIIAGIALVILWYTVWLPAEEARKKELKRAEGNAGVFLNTQDVNTEAQRIFDEEFSNDGYNKACVYFKGKIDDAKTQKEKISLTISYVNFVMRNSGDTTEALRALDAIEQPIPNEEKREYYLAYCRIYSFLGDDKKRDEYMQLAQ